MNSGTLLPVAWAFAITATSSGAVPYGAPRETVLVYRLRGEARPLFFWLGRDDVGGGSIVIRRQNIDQDHWREEIEVLFGSRPERIPGRVNRWGYGLETADWRREAGAAPRLAGTRFEGLMRHSHESSVADVAPEKAGDGVARLYEVTRSVVSPQAAFCEFRTFTDAEEFHFQSPERLLAKYRDTLANSPPIRQGAVANALGRWLEPYGFLTAVTQLVKETVTASHAAAPPNRMRPATVFVFNSKPYTLKVTGVRREATFQIRYGTRRLRDVVILDFQCFNTVKRTRTEFTLWTPIEGELQGLPVRILLQPRWWLRLQLDVDLPASRLSTAEASGTGGMQ